MLNLRQNSRFYIGVVVLALIYCIVFPIVRDILAGEKGRVRKFILKAKQVVEEQDILACVNMISDDYKDKYGNDKQTLIFQTREAFRYYKDLSVDINKINIDLKEGDKEAYVVISGVVIGLTDSGTREMIFEKEHGELKIRLIKKGNLWQLLEIESFEPMTVMGKGVS